MALSQCVECGGVVSDNAHKCPHCDCDPRGKACAVCKRIMKVMDAVRVFHARPAYDDPDEMERDDKFVHKDCLLAVFPDVDMPCWDCRTHINVLAHGKSHSLLFSPTVR